MVKESVDQENKILPEWLKEFSQDSIEKSANIDIKPKLTIDGLGIEHSKICSILSELYKVKIPKEKAIGNNELWMVDLSYNGVNHQFIAQSGSFRFQLGVLMTKLGFSNPSELIGLPIRIWKTTSYISTPQFKGNAEVYQISLV